MYYQMFGTQITELKQAEKLQLCENETQIGKWLSEKFNSPLPSLFDVINRFLQEVLLGFI